MNNAFQITTTFRLKALEGKLASVEASLALLGQRVTDMDKVADRLVKQAKVGMVERPIIEVDRELILKKSSRKKEDVANRYACWEKLDRAGVSLGQIAKAFSCDDGSVLSAKKQGFKSGWMLRAENGNMAA
jgi:hypothetical protein